MIFVACPRKEASEELPSLASASRPAELQAQRHHLAFCPWVLEWLVFSSLNRALLQEVVINTRKESESSQTPPPQELEAPFQRGQWEDLTQTMC